MRWPRRQAWTCRRRCSRPRPPAGVPAPRVVAAGAAGGLDPGLAGRRAPRGRDDPPDAAARRGVDRRARRALTGQCARALAAHPRASTPRRRRAAGARPPRRPARRPRRARRGASGPRARRALARAPPPVRRAVGRRCTATSAWATCSSAPTGLRAVLDWELAHAGDPAEDLGWLCSRAWRFGGAGPGRRLRTTCRRCSTAYAAAGGDADQRRSASGGGRRTPRSSGR